MATSTLTERIIRCLRAVPEGMVVSYGLVARMAGNPRAARQVARILHSSSRSEELPWHRVVNREGRISLGPMQGYERQKELLEAEGVEFDDKDRIDFERFLWRGE